MEIELKPLGYQANAPPTQLKFVVCYGLKVERLWESFSFLSNDFIIWTIIKNIKHFQPSASSKDVLMQMPS